MYRISLLLMLLLACRIPANAQLADTRKGFPPFSIKLTSGSKYGVKDMPKNKAALFIYFSPDCHHCKLFLDKFLPVLPQLVKLQIIMVSNIPLPGLQKFVKDHALKQYANVKVGTEGTSFIFPSFFKIEVFPFTAVYNKQAKLVITFRQEPPIDKLIEFARRN